MIKCTDIEVRFVLYIDFMYRIILLELNFPKNVTRNAWKQ